MCQQALIACVAGYKPGTNYLRSPHKRAESCDGGFSLFSFSSCRHAIPSSARLSTNFSNVEIAPTLRWWLEIGAAWNIASFVVYLSEMARSVLASYDTLTIVKYYFYLAGIRKKRPKSHSHHTQFYLFMNVRMTNLRFDRRHLNVSKTASPPAINTALLKLVVR